MTWPKPAQPEITPPRPRLVWRKLQGWCLRYGDEVFVTIDVCRDGLDVFDFTHAAGELPSFTSVRDAAINLRLRFLALGFDVDDVPSEILGGGA